jgi:hypothetical protein
MAGGQRLARHHALDFKAGVVNEWARRRLGHDEVALLGERLLLVLIERDSPLRLTRAFPAFYDAGGQLSISTSLLPIVFRGEDGTRQHSESVRISNSM